MRCQTSHLLVLHESFYIAVSLQRAFPQNLTIRMTGLSPSLQWLRLSRSRVTNIPCTLLRLIWPRQIWPMSATAPIQVARETSAGSKLTSASSVPDQAAARFLRPRMSATSVSGSRLAAWNARMCRIGSQPAAAIERPSSILSAYGLGL